MSRFDYVAYDQIAVEQQNALKKAVQELEYRIDAIGKCLDPLVDRTFTGRAKALAITKLEEVYMWTGKAIRDEQLARIAVAKGSK